MTVAGAATFQGGVNLENTPLTNVAEPVSPQDGATKRYVDTYCSASPGLKEAWVDEDTDYVVPSGKVLVITAVTAKAAVSSYFSLKPPSMATPREQIFAVGSPGANGAHRWTRIYVPSGWTVAQHAPQETFLSGYLTAAPEGTPANAADVACGEPYTVPSGFTLVLTTLYGLGADAYFMARRSLANHDIFLNANGGVVTMERTEIYLPAGTTLRPNDPVTVCDGEHYMTAGWSGYLIPALPSP